MIRCAYNKWQKLLTDGGFWAAMGFAIVLYFSAIIYSDAFKKDDYSVMVSLFSFDRAFMMQHTEFSSVSILYACGGGYLAMFIPMVSAFAAVRLLTAERECGVLRFEIVRCGTRRYHLTNLLTGVLSGGVLMTLGFALYGIAVYLLFPRFGAYPEAMREALISQYEMAYGITLRQSYPALLAEKCLVMLLYGICAAAPAVALTGVLRSPYTALCLPFFLSYALSQMCSKLMTTRYSPILLYIRPGALADLTDPAMLRSALLIRGGTLLLLSAFYLLMQHLKTDRGA